MNSISQNIGGFITASRVPNQLIIAFTQVTTGLILLGQPLESILSHDFILLILTTQMIAAGGYIINDYYDQKIDMINRPDRVIVGIKLRRRFALLAHLLLTVLAVIIGYWIDPLMGLIHLFSGTVLWLYSNQLRRLPFFGNLAIATLSGMIFLIVSVFFRTQSNLVMIYSFFAFTITLIREIIKDIEDVKGEAAFGCKTLPVIWGIQGAKIAIYLISIVGISLVAFLLWLTKSLLLAYYFMALGPVFGWFLWKLIKADTRQHFVSLHHFCNLIILSGLVSIFLLI